MSRLHLMKSLLGSDSRVRGLDQRAERLAVDFVARPQLHVAHVLAGSLEQSRGIRKLCAQEKAHVHVRRERIDVAERGVAYAGGGMAVVQQLAHVVAARAHAFEPRARDLPELAGAALEPCLNRRVSPERSRE